MGPSWDPPATLSLPLGCSASMSRVMQTFPIMSSRLENKRGKQDMAWDWWPGRTVPTLGDSGLGPPQCRAHQPPSAASWIWEITSPIRLPKQHGQVRWILWCHQQGWASREPKAPKEAPGQAPSTPESILVHDVDGDAVEPGLELHLVFLPPERGQRLPHRGSPVGQVALVTGGTRAPSLGYSPALGPSRLGAAPRVWNSQLGQG